MPIAIERPDSGIEPHSANHVDARWPRVGRVSDPGIERSDYLVAVAGNPNTGKSTIFNALTGFRARVANYPGVTVEKKTGPLVGAEGVSLLGRVVELPLESLKVGLPVKFRPLVKGEQTVVGFGPA